MPRQGVKRRAPWTIETKGAQDQVAGHLPQATIAMPRWLRQALGCDKPLTSLLRRRERSMSQGVVGQHAVWVSERALSQELCLTRPVTTVSSWRFAENSNRLPLLDTPVVGSSEFPKDVLYLALRLPPVWWSAILAQGPRPRREPIAHVRAAAESGRGGAVCIGNRE
jgi:hypothetical protein